MQLPFFAEKSGGSPQASTIKEVLVMNEQFDVQVGLVVFSVDGRAQFGWRDIETGAFHAEADGQCIPNAIAAVEFCADVLH